MSYTVNELDQLTIAELRAKVAELTRERDDLLWALQWGTGKLSDDNYTGANISACANRVIEIERRYATTAPEAK